MGPKYQDVTRIALVPLLVLLLVGLLAGACGPGAKPTVDEPTVDGSPSAADGQTTEAGDARAAELVTDKALVQVLFYGLMVFDTEKVSADSPELGVYLRRIPSHRALLSVGISNHQGHTWKTLENLRGVKTLSFNLAGDLRVDPSDDLGNYPGKNDASDPGWMLSVAQLERAARGPNRAQLTPRVLFRSGTLETCGLVHEREGGICRIRSGGLGTHPTVVRSMAEYMVVRQEVELDHPLKADLDGRSIEITPTELSGCTAENPTACVRWGDKLYGKVFDVAIRNLPDPKPGDGQRTMSTNHAQRLKGIFPGAANSWKMVSPDCDADGHCKCADSTLQPSCFEYFSQFTEVGNWKKTEMMSGTDRPICPLVSYP